MRQEEVWDAIAGKWAEFRARPIREIREFLEGKRGKVLDLGCGSGRNFVETENLEFYGVDFSEKFLGFAREKGYTELKKGMTYEIPYGNEFFDWIVFVRVLHCVDSAEKRKKSLEEVYRVLKDGGEALVSVWGRGQDRLKNRVKEGFVPWSVDGKKFERYTYIYDRDEFENLLTSVGFEIVKTWEDGNINVIVRKVVMV
ncbi:class I SAM-dependent methyltransferase [Candidatus Pacearchaeota archaeon]|nr:class I SAM-dependent methyltransferase [Candidatus Pacearchaeota archaeon]